SHFDAQSLSTFWVALLLLPFITVLRLRQAALRGLQHVAVSQLAEMVIQPLLLLALGGGAFLLLRADLSAPLAVGLNAVATGIACLIGGRQLQKTLPVAVYTATPEYCSRAWLRGALPFLFTTGMSLLNTRIDILMLGAVRGVEAVG